MNWRHGEPTPAIVVLPPAAASLDEAHAAIEQWEHYSAKTLDDAQVLAVELMMAESSTGRWAARSTGRAVSRQNGKGDEFEVVESWGLTQRAEAIMHTAHEIPTAKSAHLRLVAHLHGHRDLRRLVKQVRYANGDQSIEMHNGGICAYRTRTSGGARGLDDISRLIVDEAQHAQPEQLASSTPILAVNPNPQVNFAGTGGIASVSAWWWGMRKRALLDVAGRVAAGQFAWLEHSAEQVSLAPDGRVISVKPDVNDEAAWRQGNHGYPARIEHAYLEEQLRILGPDLYAREHLCVWDPEPLNSTHGDIDLDAWAELADPKAERGKRVVFGVDVDTDRLTHIAVAWRRPDGLVQVMLADTGVSPLNAPDRLKDLAKTWQGPIMLGGPSLVFEGDVKDSQVMTSAEFASACGRFDDLLREHGLRHGNQAELNASVHVAKWRDFGMAGERSLQLRGAPLIGPLAAVIRALHGLLSGLGAPTAPPTSAAKPAKSDTSDLATMSF